MRPIRKSRVRILVEHSVTIDEMINRLVEAETLFGVAREDVRVGLLHPGRNKLDLGVSYHIVERLVRDGRLSLGGSARSFP